MKRIVYNLVLICVLGSNMAWAWDSHPQILTGHVTVEAGLSTLDDQTGLDNQDQHDHYCCCGSAHVVALGVDTPAFVTCPAVKSDIGYCNTFLNYISPPPNKPPRI